MLLDNILGKYTNKANTGNKMKIFLTWVDLDSGLQLAIIK